MKTIKEIAEDMHGQDNLATANPIYSVMQRVTVFNEYGDRFEYDEFVQPFFSRKEASRYILENEHNLKNPFIFVNTAYRNREWIAIQSFLESQIIEEDEQGVDVDDAVQQIIDEVNSSVVQWPIDRPNKH